MFTAITPADSASRAKVRIAIPSFKFGRLKSISAKPEMEIATREEFQDLFNEELRRVRSGEDH